MINLLPPEHKRALIFARRNTQLRRAVGGLGIGIGVLLLVIATNYLILRQEIASYHRDTEVVEQELKENNEAATLSRMREINSTLNVVTNVLSEQVRFADLFQQTGRIMPTGTVLQGLSLSGGASGGVNLQAGAVNEYTASQILVNLQDPANRIFEKADLLNITCNNDSEDAYICTASIRATFLPESQFSFLPSSEEVSR